MGAAPDEEVDVGGPDDETRAGTMTVAQLKRIRNLQLQGEAAMTGVLRTATLLRHKVRLRLLLAAERPRRLPHGSQKCSSICLHMAPHACAISRIERGWLSIRSWPS